LRPQNWLSTQVGSLFYFSLANGPNISPANKFAVKMFKPNVEKFQPVMLSTDNFTTADYLLLVKGAPDVLIPRCITFLDASGDIRPLDAASVAGLKKAQESFASQGQRVLLLARKIMPVSAVERTNLSDLAAAEEFLKTSTVELTVIGLVALVDPPKPDTAETVRICRQAGIRFAMVTGKSRLSYVCRSNLRLL
jgi:sodium/potassium-transporting ATPase subunit alpha